MRSDRFEPLPDANWRQKLRRQSTQWYQRHARDLPWRRTGDPYHVWISEIMLQQTQVTTVIPYFERFVSRFPTIRALATATEQQVLRLWEGLGYYRRARQLHAAAKQIVRHHNGCFPEQREHVAELPGIGRYTRGAILSIAFDQREPILEANTIRLYSRLLAFRGDPASKTGQDYLWNFATDILPRKNVGRFNQAMMELGSTICTPKVPRCLLCPVAAVCPTRAAGLQSVIPAAKKKMTFVEIAETAVVVSKKNRVLLRQCQDGERWAGLWDFPRFSSATATPTAEFDAEQVRKLTGVGVEMVGDLAQLKHGVTKYRIRLACRTARFVEGRVHRGGQLIWIPTKRLSNYPLSATGRKIAELIAGERSSP